MDDSALSSKKKVQHGTRLLCARLVASLMYTRRNRPNALDISFTGEPVVSPSVVSSHESSSPLAAAPRKRKLDVGIIEVFLFCHLASATKVVVE